MGGTSGKMWAIRKTAPGPGLEMTTVEVPKIGPGDVLVRVRAASICGTDLHIYDWNPWARDRIKPPLTVGHEFCGDVVAVGSEVHTVQVGDFVSAESHIVDGTCAFCRTGRGHLCPNTRIIGVDRDGAWAEYVAIPSANAWKDPPDMPPHIATLKENFGNAVHTAFAVDLRARVCLVTGCGPVGVMAISVARAGGARQIIATDISDYRLDLAHQMGADITINARSDDAVASLFEATNGEGVDAWLEMSGSPAAVEQGFRVLKKGGEVAMLGLPEEPFRVDLGNWVIFKGAVVRGITGRRLWETWFQMEGLLTSGAVNLEQIVTHRFPFDKFEEALRVMESGKSGKVVLLAE
jgi:threonine 3-dehydrogenase